MLLAFDVGNTNTVFGIFDNSKLLKTWRIATYDRRTSDQYSVILNELFNLHGLNFSNISDIIISTVVPRTLFELDLLSKNVFNIKPFVVTNDIKLNFDILIDKPSELGADRIANTAAANKKYGNNTIILDFGTATNIDVTDDNGNYIGGLIAPGVNLSVDALHRAAAKLPNVAVQKTEKVMATNTVNAMQSGIFWGYLSMIEGLITKIKNEIPRELKTVSTGGLAPIFFDETKLIDYLDQDLTMEGLQLIFELNN